MTTLNLGLAKDTLNKWTPWGSDDDQKSRPGAEFGCDLVRSAAGKIHVSRIADTSPAALSGLVAVGDELLRIDGKSLADWADTGIKLNDLTAGEEGTAVWLEVQLQVGDASSEASSLSRTVCLIRQKPLDEKGWAWSDVQSKVTSSASAIKSSFTFGAVPKISAPAQDKVSIAELGIDLKVLPEGQVVVEKVVEGGAAWLTAQGKLEDSGGLLAEGDVIRAVNNQALSGDAGAAASAASAASSLLSVAKVTSAFSGNTHTNIETLNRAAQLLRGSVFSRVDITLERERCADSPVTITTVALVRAPLLKPKFVDLAKEFQRQVAALPAIPPSERASRREAKK